MKSLLPLLLFLSLPAFAQQPIISKIDSLPASGLLLDKGWKWHAGDNPDFAKADFDDSKWEDIDPTKDIKSLEQVDNVPISWFRLKIEVDSALLGKTLALLVKQTGASEIYLNGIKLHQFGKLSTNQSETEGYNPLGSPISFPVSNEKCQQIAIRFATSGIFLVRYFTLENPALKIKLSNIESIVTIYNTSIPNVFISNLTTIFEAGTFLIMAFLHLCFYLLFRKQQANFYFSGFYFTAGILSIVGTLSNYSPDLTIRNGLAIFGKMFYPFMGIFSLLALQILFNSKRGIFFWFTMSLFLLSIPLMLYPYEWGWMIGFFVCRVLFMLVAGLICWEAYKKGLKGAIGIIYGILFPLICALLAFTARLFILNDEFNLLTNELLNFSSLAYPISISYYLSVEFATNSKSLAQKLIQVETLSAEKQQILATQNETLERQVSERTAELKASQNQLIQKEKLASLGELTAGIAHEIQNPLNFVNNFSEVSVELINEIKSPLIEASNRPEGGMIDIKDIDMELFDDVVQNLEKINLHGKRAASIVSGMLEHSRTSTGERTMTDINKLADEYLRLSYHGMKAKNKNFTANYELIADENLPQINVVPQDIGRVLLNLINNAFYAVSQRNYTVETGHALSLQSQYQPIVTISTHQSDNQIIIKIKDNGIGMNEATKAKIFQPFFTTKPTGQGTGLGLSLAYDIITKGHGGTIEVESVEGEGTTFIVKLPFN